jgi:hypothetical protein
MGRHRTINRTAVWWLADRSVPLKVAARILGVSHLSLKGIGATWRGTTPPGFRYFSWTGW